MTTETQVKERAFNAKPHEVVAILAGRQTQFRRPIKLPPAPNHLGQWEASAMGGKGVTDSRGNPVEEFPIIWHTRTGTSIACPYGAPGDRLWVRENFWARHDTDGGGEYPFHDFGPCLDLEEFHPGIQYCATPEILDPPPGERNGEDLGIVPGDWWEMPPKGWDGETDYKGQGVWGFLPWGGDNPYSKLSSAQMPRWASRILLEIVSVRVERVQEISESDARAEGIPTHVVEHTFQKCYRDKEERSAKRIEYFSNLWDSINEKRGLGWDVNSWVWATEFKVVKP